jgi:hypothetical protein
MLPSAASYSIGKKKSCTSGIAMARLLFGVAVYNHTEFYTHFFTALQQSVGLKNYLPKS